MIISLRPTERKYASSRPFAHRIDPMEMFWGGHKAEWVIPRRRIRRTVLTIVRRTFIGLKHFYIWLIDSHFYG